MWNLSMVCFMFTFGSRFKDSLNARAEREKALMLSSICIENAIDEIDTMSVESTDVKFVLAMFVQV